MVSQAAHSHTSLTASGTTPHFLTLGNPNSRVEVQGDGCCSVYKLLGEWKHSLQLSVLGPVECIQGLFPYLKNTTPKAHAVQLGGLPDLATMVALASMDWGLASSGVVPPPLSHSWTTEWPAEA